MGVAAPAREPRPSLPGVEHARLRYPMNGKPTGSAAPRTASRGMRQVLQRRETSSAWRASWADCPGAASRQPPQRAAQLAGVRDDGERAGLQHRQQITAESPCLLEHPYRTARRRARPPRRPYGPGAGQPLTSWGEAVDRRSASMEVSTAYFLESLGGQGSDSSGKLIAAAGPRALDARFSPGPPSMNSIASPAPGLEGLSNSFTASTVRLRSNGKAVLAQRDDQAGWWLTTARGWVGC